MREIERTYLNLGYLVSLFIWETFRYTILEGFDGKGRFTLLLSLVIFFVNITTSKSYLKSFIQPGNSLKYWFFWVIYATINSMFLFKSDRIPLLSFISGGIFVPLIVMSLISNFPKNEIKRLLTVLNIILFTSFVIFVGFGDYSGGRLSVELIDTNELTLIVNFLVAIISLRYVRNEIDLKLYLFFITGPALFLIFAGSRMGIGNFVIILFGLILTKNNKIGVGSLLKYLVVILIFVISINYIFENTVLGERLTSTSSQANEFEYNAAEGTIFENYGDRGIYYILGWEIFLKNWNWGIGLGNFIDYYPTVCHVEYMIHFAELGIIGISLYLIFLLNLFSKILKLKFKFGDPHFLLILFIFISILFSSSVLFLYSSISIAGLYGILILFTKTIK